ncbi:MAG: aspartate--tRNA(Asn) ligase [Patescibacteria group bacterium]|nr:aspartate--tRNA(Asn) ligase [Patescibacteria group bacterium]
MRTLVSDIAKSIGKEVTVAGWIAKIRKLGGISFVSLRDRSGIAQIVVEKEAHKLLSGLSTESVVEFTGKVKKEERAPFGAEILAKDVKIISPVSEDVPVEINKKELRANIDTLLDNRPITLRNPEQRAIFKVQAEVIRAFRDFLSGEDFTEINSSKIVESGLETGGAEMFPVSWFRDKAFLSQSPQMYKQIMVGVYERVFETAYAYRAEKHSTARHLNEYLSLDFEMGFITSHEDIMEMEEKLLKYMMKHLEKTCSREFEMLGATIPKVGAKIPRMKLSEAQKVLEQEYKVKCAGAPDLDPKQEKLISEYAEKKLESEFIFITHYPSKKRPFYTYDDPKNPKETLSFDLMFRGLEVTTGGQRIHLYDEYLKKMKDRGMDVEAFADYLMAFKYGMPAHGGLAIGAERLTARLLGLQNIREASLFPRDINRLRP